MPEEEPQLTVDAAGLGRWMTGKPLEGDQAIKGALIVAAASAAARRVARQTFGLVTGDAARLQGNWTRVLELPERPVVDVTAVVLEDRPLQEDVHYKWDGRHRLLAPKHWGGDLATVTVTYDHGRAEIPENVAGIILGAAARAFYNPKGATQEQLGSYSVSFGRSGMAGGFTEFEVAHLEDYRP